MSKVIRARSINWLRRCYSNISPIAMNYTLWEPNVDSGAPPILIMHGLIGSNENWRSVAQNLIARLNRKVYTLDVRNHGSSPHTQEFSFQHIAADLLLLTETLGLSEIVALGHSMGGLSMITFSLTHPKLVERLIVVDVSPIAMPTHSGLADDIYNFLINSKLPIASVTLGEARRSMHKELMSRGANKWMASFLLRNLRKQPNGEFYWACNFPSLRDNWHELRDFKERTLYNFTPYPGPTLFIAGTQSGYVEHQHIPEIKKFFPKAAFDWIDAHHLVHVQRPREFIEIVCNFIDSHK